MFLDDLWGILKFFGNPPRFFTNFVELLDKFDNEKLVDFEHPYRDQDRFYRMGGYFETIPETNALATWLFPWDRPKHG